MSSGERVNFSVRPNKNVERKLMVELLQRLSNVLPIRTYRYVGFGSFWFSDFVLFHKTLGIDDMVSIEREEWAARAAFNVPLACVRVEAGDSTKVLPELGLGDRPSVVWLDYDKDLRGEVLDDLEIVCKEAAIGTVVMVTVNANVAQLQHTGNPPRTKLDVLRDIVGDLVPAGLTDQGVSRAGLPGTIGTILFDHCSHVIHTSGAADRIFLPLFNFRYSDAAEMVTVGGILVNAELAAKVEELEIHARDYFGGKDQFEIAIPPLTLREKMALDKLLPSVNALSSDLMKEHLGFHLKEEQVEAYGRFYFRYPMFAEFDS